MFEFLDRLDGGQIIGLSAALGGLLVAAIGICTSQWRRVRVAELDAGLKQQMLERGMSPADIEQVLRASSGSAASVASTGNESLDMAALAQRMVDNGYEGEDIERVLKAYQHPPRKRDERLMDHSEK